MLQNENYPLRETLNETHGIGDEVVDATDVKIRSRWRMRGHPARTKYLDEFSGMDFHGSNGLLSEIQISRKAINAYYRGNISGTGVLYHEFLHSADFYTGWNPFLFEALVPDKAKVVLEYNVHQRVYAMFGTQGYEFFRFQNLFNQLFGF